MARIVHEEKASETFSSWKKVPDTFGGENAEECEEQLQVMETGCGPESESALLRDLPMPNRGRADPLESHTYRNRRARLNAYRHRLQALRRDYVNARLHALEIEDRLNEALLRIDQMQATRGWKLLERCRHGRRTVRGWLQRLRALTGRNSG